MPFIATNRDDVPWWGHLATVGIGLATLSAGLFTIRGHPATTTELDAAAGVGRVTTRGFARAARTETFPLADVRALEVISERDSDGDPMFRMRLWLSGSRTVWLQANPVYGANALDAPAARIRSFLGV